MKILNLFTARKAIAWHRALWSSLGVAAVVLCACQSMKAADGEWTGGEANNLWQDGGNWSPASFPGTADNVYTSNDAATFSTAGGGAIDLEGQLNIQSILFGVGAGDANAFIVGDANDTLNLTTAGTTLMGMGVTTGQQIGVAGTTINLSDVASSMYSFTNDSTAPAAKLDIVGNITTAAGSGTSGLTLNGTNGGTVSGNITDGGTANLGLTKLGTGTWTLSGANGYTGGTNINDGTLVIGATNTLAITGAVVLNSDGSGSTPATLDLSNFSQTLGSLAVRNGATTVGNADTITIGNAQALTVNGDVTIGRNAVSSTTFATVSGDGSFIVGDGTVNRTFQVGGYTSTGAGGNAATLNMADLSTFSANLGSGGTFRIGDVASASSPAAALSTVTLAKTSTIRAGTLDIGATTRHEGVQTLKLGDTENTIEVNNINVGSAEGGQTGGRGSGEISFNSTTGSLTIRNAAGDGRANLSLASTGQNTAADVSAVMDLRGHHADLLLNTLAVAIRPGNATGGAEGTLWFDEGTLDVTTVTLARKNNGGGTGGGAGGNNTSTATLNIGGGTVAIGTGGIAMAFVGASPRVAHATVNITGGTVTLGGDITRNVGGGAGTSTATVNLDGGILDMGGKVIGGANAVTFNAESGTLQNLGELNNGGTLTKTTASTLILAGTNEYTGATAITAGTFRLNGTHTAGGTYTVSDGATLDGIGSTTADVFVDTLGFIAPGNSIGELTVGNTEILGTYLLETNLSGDADLLTVLGTLTLGGSSSLDLLTSIDFSPDEIYTIAYYDSLVGEFDTVHPTITATHTVDYGTGSNSMIRLVPVPEPGALAMLVFGSAFVWFMRKTMKCER